MRKIIKSYLKSFFKNHVESFGLIFFMIIIMATVAGILSAPIQYLSHFNAVLSTSKKWNNSLELIVPNIENGITTTTDKGQPKITINKVALYQPTSTSLKPYFLVNLLTDEKKSSITNNFPIIDQASRAYQSWLAATSIVTQEPINQNKQELGVFLNNEIFNSFDQLRQNILGTVNTAIAKNQLQTPNSPFWTAFAEALKPGPQKIFKYSPFKTFTPGLTLSPIQKTWIKIFTQDDFNLQLLIPHYLFSTYQMSHPGQTLLWNYSYFHNILLAEKAKTDKNYSYLLETTTPSVFTDNNDYATNALKLYSGRAPSAPNDLLKNQRAEAAIGYSAAKNNNWKLHTNITLYLNATQTLNLNVTGIGITLDTVIAKTGSTLSGAKNNSFFSPPLLNYSPIYTSNAVINELEGAYLNNSGASSRYKLSDTSELYFNTANGQNSTIADNQLNTILKGTRAGQFDPLKAPDAGNGLNPDQSYLTYKEAPIATNSKNNDTSLIINITISFVLILLGFVFVNFTMKKEINKTCGQLGLFKAFGYRDLDLSWIFATKFFVTTIISTGIGYLISLGIQPFVAQAYQNSVLFPFTAIYVSPIFLSFLFIVIPGVFVLISYLLNFYFLKQPVLNLINGNPRMRISLLARFFGRVFRKTTFVVRVQIAFTFKAFSKYLAVLFVFIIAALLFQATLSGLYLFNGLAKNIFVTSTPDVDHISYADSNLTTSHLNPPFKPPKPPASAVAENNNVALPHLQFNNNISNTKYIGAPNGVNKSEVNTFIEQYGNAINAITQGFSNQLTFYPNPTGLDFWNQARFELKVGTQVQLSQASIKQIAEKLQKEFMIKLPMQNSLLSIMAYFAMTAVPDNTWIKTPIKIQINPQVNVNPAYTPAQAAALQKIFKNLNITQKDKQTLPNLANVITQKFATFLDQSSAGYKAPGQVNYQPWQVPLPSALSAFALTSLFAQEQKTFEQIPQLRNLKLNINANGAAGEKKFNANRQVNFVNALLLQYPLLKDPSKSFINFNALYYDQDKEQPILRATLYDLRANVDRTSFQAVGIQPQDWNKFWRFGGVHNANSIITANWTYQQPVTPIPVIISAKLATTQKWKLNQVVPISLNNNIQNPFRIQFRIDGIVTRDTLSNQVYLNRNSLLQLFQLYGHNDQNLLQDNPQFSNGITSKRVLTKANINVSKFQAGLQRVKFSIENIGVALLNSVNPTSKQHYKFWSVLGLTDVTNPQQPQPSPYNVDSNYSLLINTTRNIPISVIKQASENTIRQFQQVLILMEILVTLTTAVILIVVVSAILDESKAVILMMKAIGYTSSQVNFVVIGNYFIAALIAFALAYFINIGLWAFVNKTVYNITGVVLGLPLAPMIPLVGLALIISIITIGWIVSYNITKRAPLSEVSTAI